MTSNFHILRTSKRPSAKRLQWLKDTCDQLRAYLNRASKAKQGIITIMVAEYESLLDNIQ